MNLISCDFCGVVLDGDKLEFPDDIYEDEENGVIDHEKAGWCSDRRNYFPKAECPVCEEEILKP